MTSDTSNCGFAPGIADYSLISYAINEDWSLHNQTYTDIQTAKNQCISMGDRCSGVNQIDKNNLSVFHLAYGTMFTPSIDETNFKNQWTEWRFLNKKNFEKCRTFNEGFCQPNPDASACRTTSEGLNLDRKIK